jgi:hypothetical protein
MSNPDAMLAVMLAGDPESVGLGAHSLSEDRYERLFAIRAAIIEHHRADQPVDIGLGILMMELNRSFNEMPSDEDVGRAVEIIQGLFNNPNEINDLNESQIRYIEDVAVNIGIVRTLLYSYGVQPSEDFLNSERWMNWFVRYRLFMVV